MQLLTLIQSTIMKDRHHSHIHMTATFSKMKVILVSISHFLKKLSFEVIINLEKDFQVFGQYFSHLNKTLLLEKNHYMVINYQKNYWVLSLFLKMSKSNLHFTQQCGWYYCVLKETEFFFLTSP